MFPLSHPALSGHPLPTPELIAHRGASRERPENSLPAFARAVELGADAVELDVHLTVDGHLVVHHDPEVSAAGRGVALQTLTLADLRPLRVRGEPVPTLDEVLGVVGTRLRIYCELKGPGTARAAIGLLAPLGARAAVHSFDHRLIAQARTLDPVVPRGVLESSYHVDPAESLRAVGARDLWQHASLVDQALVGAVHAAGGRVIVWTVNDADRAVALARLGVDGICTDDVAGIRRALSRDGAAEK